jgi:hypothetical protein
MSRQNINGRDILPPPRRRAFRHLEQQAARVPGRRPPSPSPVQPRTEPPSNRTAAIWASTGRVGDITENKSRRSHVSTPEKRQGSVTSSRNVAAAGDYQERVAQGRNDRMRVPISSAKVQRIGLLCAYVLREPVQPVLRKSAYACLLRDKSGSRRSTPAKIE